MRIAGPTALLLAALVAGPAQADCLEEIKTILASSLTSGPFAMEMEATEESGVMTISAEFVAPDSMHTKVVFGTTTMEATVLNGRAWVDMGTGEGWTEYPENMSDTMMATFQGATAEMLDSVTAEECLGTQNVDGRDLLAFKYHSKEDSILVKSTLYVDPVSRLPVITETQSNFDGISTDMRAVYRYDPTIKVVAPNL